jgi:hypothetical protein
MNKIPNKKKLTVLGVLGIATFFGQSSISVTQLSGISNTLNPITTAVPFLMISPDSKQGAMGDVGAATEVDVNSIHWNGSKLAFADKKFGVGFTVTPWLRLLVPDINMSYLAGYVKLNDKQTIGGSLRYFSLGNIELTNSSGQKTSDFRPNEFAIDIAFSQKLSKFLGLGVATRFINSSISKAPFGNQNGANAASTFAVDLSMYFKSNKFKLGDKKATVTSGLAFTNIGAKIKYANDQNFIPMNMRLGSGLKTDLDDYNSFSFYLDFNKLLVPTPPEYLYVLNSSGQAEIVIDPATGKKAVFKGKDPNVPVAQGILQSFSDAPGGFNEELREVNTSVGMEYSYDKTFFVRGGYFHESRTKGGRQFFTIGVGFKFKVITVDGSYLIPTKLQNPLQRTWRISLSFNFDPAAKTDKEPINP